jgi:type II secretory pathway component PulF
MQWNGPIHLLPETTGCPNLHLSTIVLAVVTLLMAAFVLLTFYVPVLVWEWDKAGRPLAVWERALSGLSGAAQSAFGTLFLGLLVLCMIATFAWRAIARAQLRRDTIAHTNGV